MLKTFGPDFAHSSLTFDLEGTCNSLICMSISCWRILLKGEQKYSPAQFEGFGSARVQCFMENTMLLKRLTPCHAGFAYT